MVVQRLDSLGPLLDASCDLLLQVFDPAVVDSKEAYIDALTEDLGSHRDFRRIFVAAIFRDTPKDLLAGFVSADSMWDDRADVVQYLAPQAFGFLRQTSALDIGEAQALLAEHLPQYAILFLQVLNDIKLLTVYATSKDSG